MSPHDRMVECDPAPLLAASRLTTLTVLAWSAVGTGVLLILTGPRVVAPHIAAEFAQTVLWPIGPGILFTVAGSAMGWALWRGSRRILVLASWALAVLYGVLALGFAIQAAEAAQQGAIVGFVYPVAVYAGLAGLHAVQADTTIRSSRMRGPRG